MLALLTPNLTTILNSSFRQCIVMMDNVRNLRAEVITDLDISIQRSGRASCADPKRDEAILPHYCSFMECGLVGLHQLRLRTCS